MAGRQTNAPDRKVQLPVLGYTVPAENEKHRERQPGFVYWD